jgi:hypothetical protein
LLRIENDGDRPGSHSRYLRPARDLSARTASSGEGAE